ncbi:MAG: carboxypeptidase-like regulatory domain-containing protein [Pyrinomonadaceae bacterium]
MFISRLLTSVRVYAPRLTWLPLLIMAPLIANGQTPCTGVTAATVAPPFNASYSCVGLGGVPGVPASYGGLTLKYDDPNVLLIGGAANGSTGAIYQIGVVRDAATKHITGFSGTATLYPSAGSTLGQNNDGGVIFGPGNVLFTTGFPINQLFESKPGSAAPDKTIDLTPLGIGSSVGSVAFVPNGFPGAGQMKIVSYSASTWYSTTIAPDANGTYDVTSATSITPVGTGPEGIAFVPLNSPVFAPGSFNALVALFGSGKVVTFQLDLNGDPVPASSRDFITGLSGAEGAFIDTLTGDFLFSTFGGSAQVIRVGGFLAPTAAPVTISGRVLSARASGLRNTRVALTDEHGATRTAVTNTFGYFSFNGVPTGERLVLSASAKGYRFSPRAITLHDSLTDLQVIAAP